ncbi:phage tail protein [Citrobacter sp. NCU1]|uniref:phage tail protein n=1 Tax=Citrobacter sp. NCU1 TaxID=2026683 RepID=UPI0013907542|nr:phage tail protein [Citrobacter sp. NCU1]NDO81499.1 phage tail protein [Citrobacter sp. NCU1]
MKQIPYAVGQAAGVAVMPINADATNTNTSGGASVFAGLVISRRGKPGEVLRVTANNFESVLGAAIHPRQGAIFEPLRHVERATKGGDGYVVRVCPSDMKIPTLAFMLDAETKKLTVTASTVNVGAAPALPEGAYALIYIDDGDASASRAINFYEDETSEGLFMLELQETDSAGTVTILESHQVSFDPEARSDMGTPAFMDTALENGSTRLRALVADDAHEALSQLKGEAITVEAAPFVGGSDGDMSKLVAKDYQKALTVLKKSMFSFTAVLSLGCYDPTVIADLDKFAQDVRVDMFYDLLGAQTAALAITEAKSHGLGGSHQPCRYYFPYSCRDVFTSANVVFGISCDAFVAKAKGVALVPDVGGWHYSPAGVSRAIISRQNIKPIPNLDEIDNEEFVKARINPVAMNSAGDLYIDDALTTLTKNNYLRLQHISSLMNAIARGFYEVAEAAKHEPDGVTYTVLMSGMTDLLERFAAAEAIVKPRDPSQGESPFALTLIQKDIDLWELEWAVCPTGSSRRIVGKPMLLR